jgi:type I restriction-modification system DNA methylase subunit
LKDRIIKEIDNMAGKYSAHEIFTDWVTMTAVSISNSVDSEYYAAREKTYREYAAKYTSAELRRIARLNGMLVEAMETEMSDMLGYIYMNLESNSKKAGQFFTPYHICRMMGRMMNPEIDSITGWIGLNEPSTGAGGNVIAFCEGLRNRGINYQEHCMAVCQDLDMKCVYMSYVQLSYYGIPAIVVQGDTLQNAWTMSKARTDKTFMTPVYVLNMHRFTHENMQEEINM